MASIAQEFNPLGVLPIGMPILDFEPANRAVLVVPHARHQVELRFVVELPVIVLSHAMTVHRLLGNEAGARGKGLLNESAVLDPGKLLAEVLAVAGNGIIAGLDWDTFDYDPKIFITSSISSSVL